MRLATPAAHGNAPAWPATRAHTSTRKARKGRSRLWGCQGSTRISLPMAHSNPRKAAATAHAPVTPATRRAQRTPSTTDATCSATTATTVPAATSTLAGPASTSKSSGPGLLMRVPTVSDAEVQVPSSGWWSVSTSRARRLK